MAAVSGGGIYVAQSASLPSLGITTSGIDVVLSWVVPSMNFVLQENSNLGATNWADVPAKPTLNLRNLQNEVVLPSLTGNRFYG